MKKEIIAATIAAGALMTASIAIAETASFFDPDGAFASSSSVYSTGGAMATMTIGSLKHKFHGDEKADDSLFALSHGSESDAMQGIAKGYASTGAFTSFNGAYGLGEDMTLASTSGKGGITPIKEAFGV